MPGQAINVTLDLDGLEVVGVDVHEELIELVVESGFGAGSCRSCGGIASEPKERPEVVVRDLPISGRPVMLRWRKRRWRCRYCSSSWTEVHPEIPPRARMTTRFKLHLAARAKVEANFSQVAALEAVSYDTVARAHRQRAHLVRQSRPRPAPKVISIDEAAIKKGHIYNTVISDVLARYVIDTIEGRDAKALREWILDLDEDVRKGIEVVVMDLWNPFHSAVARCLPHAIRVGDKFHVIRQANLALDRVRGRVQGRGKKLGVARWIFNCRFTLLRAKERPRDGDDERLAWIFEVAPEIHRAWQLKEALRSIYEIDDPQDAANQLRGWTRRCEESGLPEFEKLARLVCRWETEILNYFTYRITNAFAEGITNRIKVIKRQGYGVPSFEGFRDRILVQCGVPKALGSPA